MKGLQRGPVGKQEGLGIARSLFRCFCFCLFWTQKIRQGCHHHSTMLICSRIIDNQAKPVAPYPAQSGTDLHIFEIE